MNRFSDNYYHRKCYFERVQVPTQSVMKDRMELPLANVYFKSMPPKIKVIAGLEPPMKGGGNEWYMPPEEILRGRHVLQPVKLQHLKKMGFDGLSEIGEKLRQQHFRAMKAEMRQALLDSDNKWKNIVLENNRYRYKVDSREEARANSKSLRLAVREFEMLYRTSISDMESMIFDAAVAEIQRIRGETFQEMKEHYENLVKYQAAELYEAYDAKLRLKKAEMKEAFIKKVEALHTETDSLLHDIYVEKHTIIEKLRNMLQCQNLACQMYVAMKEREECKKEIEQSKKEHGKKIKELKEDIDIKDFEIHLGMEQQQKRQEFNRIWKKKICHIVKKFQTFVEYCLKTLPQHAEFFLNMETLMMLQLNEASVNPSAESIIETETEFNTPIPNPHPFYLFCDKGFKPKLEKGMCPKHCTSSASHIPVTVINKRFIYCACDKFEVFSEKVVQFLGGLRGEDSQFEDYHKYELDVPIKYTSTTNLKEVKLESSIMQILQQELPNIRELPIECKVCKTPYCFCSPLHASQLNLKPEVIKPAVTEDRTSISSGKKIETRSAELKLHREPKWESYFDYALPKKCRCAKTAKKHLVEHLPLYMRLMSPFEPPELPHYEPCQLETLKRLVKKAKGKRTPPPTVIVESRTRDVATQFSDHEFDLICECLSEDALSKLLDALLRGSKVFSSKTNTTRGSLLKSESHSYLTKTASTFATHRAFSLRQLIGTVPVLEEIFQKNNCN